MVAIGVLVGLVSTAISPSQRAASWPFFGNKELDKSSDYVRDILQLVNENYVDPGAADYTKLTRSALKGMIDSLDPHSEFLEAGNYREVEEEMSGKFGGIGIRVEVKDKRIVVIAPIAGTPGERAGIQRGDEIQRIDDKPVTELDTVIEELRGAPKSQVTLTLFRPSTGATINATLTREIIKVESVRRGEQLLGKATGYLQITEFTGNTGEEFSRQLAALRDKGMTSLILDLRNNPGGLLDAAVKVAEPFFRNGELIVYTQGRKKEDREEYRATRKSDPISIPMVVLINAGSASAAEIVAGALKDTGRAVIVGERSFGKGSVQSVFKLKDGEGLRLTTALYFTPSGKSIHQKGIDPNVEVIMTPDEDTKLQIQRIRDDVKTADFEKRFGFAPIADRQLDAALDILGGIDAYSQRLTAR